MSSLLFDFCYCWIYPNDVVFVILQSIQSDEESSLRCDMINSFEANFDQRSEKTLIKNSSLEVNCLRENGVAIKDDFREPFITY